MFKIFTPHDVILWYVGNVFLWNRCIENNYLIVMIGLEFFKWLRQSDIYNSFNPEEFIHTINGLKDFEIEPNEWFYTLKYFKNLQLPLRKIHMDKTFRLCFVLLAKQTCTLFRVLCPIWTGFRLLELSSYSHWWWEIQTDSGVSEKGRGSLNDKRDSFFWKISVLRSSK